MALPAADSAESGGFLLQLALYTEMQPTEVFHRVLQGSLFNLPSLRSSINMG